MQKTLFIFCLLIGPLFGCYEDCKNIELNSELDMTIPTEKIWAHRVNNLKEIETRAPYFKGIEVDIFYNPSSSNFTVKHDSSATGIDFEQFLDAAKEKELNYFWLDYKNLNVANEDGIKKLSTILADRNLSKTSFVESYYTHDLEKLNGTLSSSLWVPNVAVPNGKSERDELYHKQYEKFKEIEVTMISSSYEMFDFLTEYFPEYKCNYWMPGNLNNEQIAKLKKMANSPQVNIILIDGDNNPLE